MTFEVTPKAVWYVSVGVAALAQTSGNVLLRTITKFLLAPVSSGLETVKLNDPSGNISTLSCLKF